MNDAHPHILIVDDDEIILLALAESLAPRGYQVTTTNNPLEALEALQRRTFAVIVSDQRMAEMNGLDFLCQCKDIQPEASRILITGVQTIKTLIEAVNRSEIFRFVAKPWMREDLIQVIECAAQRYHNIRSNREASDRLQTRINELEEELAQLRNSHP